MGSRSDVRDFLTSRRARLAPEAAGLPEYGGVRRVPGLRRAEVAMLAGVSVDYYNRLERGDLRGVSSTVLDAISRVLQLDEAEDAHLQDLASQANAPLLHPARRMRGAIRAEVQRVLDSMVEVPAWIRNNRLDLVAANRLGRALFVDLVSDPTTPPNVARFLFLDPRARAFFPDWDEVADDTVAVLRSEVGSDPGDRELAALISELSERSEPFRDRWASHDVAFHRSGAKRVHHPVIGDLAFEWEAMGLGADAGLIVLVYTAEPGSPTEDGLRLLSSWAATEEAEALIGAAVDDR